MSLRPYAPNAARSSLHQTRYNLSLPWTTVGQFRVALATIRQNFVVVFGERSLSKYLSWSVSSYVLCNAARTCHTPNNEAHEARNHTRATADAHAGRANAMRSSHIEVLLLPQLILLPASQHPELESVNAAFSTFSQYFLV